MENMTSPCVDSTNESKISNPVFIIPETLREGICRQLPPSAYLSVITTSEGWNRKLVDQKTTCLFPLVLSQVMKYLPKETMLEIRKIRKSAKNRVDDILQGYHHTSPDQTFKFQYQEELSQDLNFNTQVMSISSRYHFGRWSNKTSNFIGIVGSGKAQRNPFLTRNISFHGFAANNPQELKEFANLQHLFSHVGHEIWRAESVLYVLDKKERDGTTTVKLATLLNLLPNLKMLRIRDGLRMSDELELLQASPFPRLDKLSYLDVEDVDVNSFARKCLLHYAPQLKYVSCKASLFDEEECDLSPDKLNQLFPALRKLRIQNVRSNMLYKLSQVNWALEELNLNGCKTENLVDFLLALGNFGGTLQKLVLTGSWESWTYSSIIRTNEPEPEELDEVLKTGVIQEMSQLKIIFVGIAFLEREWFWQFVRAKCQQLRELHISWYKYNPTYFEEVSGKAEENLEKLEKIVVWNCDTPAVAEVVKRCQ